MDRTIDVACDSRDNPNTLRFCDQSVLDIPFQHEFKLSVVQPLPAGFQAGFTMTNWAGGPTGSRAYATPGGARWTGLSTNWSLSRTTRYAADCPGPCTPGALVIPTLTDATLVVPLVAPGEEFTERFVQLGLQVSRIFRFGEKRLTTIPATGSEDPEPVERARVNAPATVRTLDRIVSLADFEDFARTFAGIGWASASNLDDGRRPFVHLTVALVDGSPLDVDSETAQRLRTAIARVRHTDRRVVVSGHTPRRVDVVAAVRLDPAYRAADVIAGAQAAVTGLFDRERSGFGALLTPTVVLGSLHGVAGVRGAVLSTLRDAAGGGAPVQELLARPARIAAGAVVPAELLEAATIHVSELGATYERGLSMSVVTGASLYERLPAYYRDVDTRAGGVVRALLDIIAEEADRIGRQIDQQADDWFIETCSDWAVSYIGDLLGVAPTHDVAATATSDAVVSRRALVANTIRYRRRKGTASVLESLATDVSGWRTVAVDQFERLVTTQHLGHPRTTLPNTVDVRAGVNLELTPGPFARHAHTVDVRSMPPRSRQPGARPNVANVSLHTYPVDGLVIPDAVCVPAAGAEAGTGRYRVDPLGRDLPLVNPPVHDRGVDVRAVADEVPMVLGRRRLRDELDRRRSVIVGSGGGDPHPRWQTRPPFAVALTVAANDEPAAVDPLLLDVCSLDPWKSPSPSGRIRVDPVNGRVVVPDPQPARVLVSASPGVVAGLGAGPAPRPASTAAVAAADISWQRGVTAAIPPVTGSIVASLGAAIASWNTRPAGTRGVIVLMESARHDIDLTGSNRIRIPEGSQLTIVGADWPLLPVIGGAPGQTARRLGVINAERVRPCLVGDIEVDGRAPLVSTQPGRLTLDGVLLDGTVRVVGAAEQLGELEVRHCTQVAGTITATGVRTRLGVTVTASRVGAIVVPEEVGSVAVTASVVDGAGAAAIDAPGGRVELDAVTTLGVVNAHELHASDCLLAAAATAAIRQRGCVRYSFVAPGSATGRQYRCVDTPPPAFVSTDRAHRAYAALAVEDDSPLRTGAENGGEYGAFNALRWTDRRRNVVTTLADYLRLGTTAGVTHEF